MCADFGCARAVNLKSVSAVSPAERQQHLAKMSGQTTSVQKAAAARNNGAKGGRPKKRAVVTNAKKAVRKVAASVRNKH